VSIRWSSQTVFDPEGKGLNVACRRLDAMPVAEARQACVGVCLVQLQALVTSYMTSQQRDPTSALSLVGLVPASQ
jgi:hypothetical protein